MTFLRAGSSDCHDHGHKRSSVDRVAIFADILARNALRREVKLPTLDVHRVYRREVEQALWREHVERHHEATMVTVLHELRAKQGPNFPQSAGGRWAVNALVAKALKESFKGVRQT